MNRRRESPPVYTQIAVCLTLGLVAGCYEGAAVSSLGGPHDADATDSAEEGDEPEVPTCIEENDSGTTIRRLTRFEYNNTVRDLLGTPTFPANGFPSEELANGFGNDASAQSVSSLLAEQYNVAAEALALEATATPEAFARIAPCSSDLGEGDTAATDACARSFIESFGALSYRRPLTDDEIDALTAFEQMLRADADFNTSAASVVEFLLQSPDFLYRVEHGFIDAQGRHRPTSHEMASRLSYFLWGTMPDDTLRAAADNDALGSGPEVREHAERMLADPRARAVVRFFFDNALPISGLQHLERDTQQFPSYDAQVGAAMREEIQTFLAHEIFEGSGTWDAVLTAPHTFVNETLATFYGIEGVVGDAFVQVDLDPEQRRGLLTQAGMLAGTIHSNETNPVTRGAFITRALMCTDIPVPTGEVAEEVTPPDPDSGATARERFSKHREDPVCASCHALMDPLGLTFENFDAVGQWRDNENGVAIDPTGALPGFGAVAGPLELIDRLAASDVTHACFVTHWSNFAYGRTATDADECTHQRLVEQFDASGHDIQQLIIDLTQTDDFLYMAPGEGQ